jgi:hypothetical protein
MVSSFNGREKLCHRAISTDLWDFSLEIGNNAASKGKGKVKGKGAKHSLQISLA